MAVLRQSKVKYRQPAAGEIELTGTATCDANVATTFLKTLYDRGRAVLEVSAVVEQAGTAICQTDLRWFATQRSDASG